MTQVEFQQILEMINRSRSCLKEKLKGDQHKIDMNKNGKIDAEDFMHLRKKTKPTMEEAELDEGSMHAARPRNASRPGTEPAKKGSLQDRIMAARARIDAKKKDVKEEVEDVMEGSQQIYKVVALDKGNALKKPTKMKVKADSIEDLFSRLSANDWYPLEINGVKVIAGKRLKEDVAEEAEQVDEVSMDYLRKKDYMHKAEVSRKDAENTTRQYWKSPEEKQKARETVNKRDKGIGAYTDRLYKTMKKPEYKTSGPEKTYPLGGHDPKSNRSYSE
jgi:hypothetical protein